MAQRKETKTKIKVRDLQPKKDAKGGFVMNVMSGQSTSAQSPKQPTGPSQDRIFGP
jgi:hypothetical protein